MKTTLRRSPVRTPHITMHTTLRKLSGGATLALGLSLSHGIAHATPVEFSFTAALNAPMHIGLWYESVQDGWSSAMSGAVPTAELAALRAANPVLHGNFGWDTGATGIQAPWGATYAGQLGVSVLQGGQPVRVANPAANVTVVNGSNAADTVAVTWNTWPNSFNSGLLDVAAAQPQDTRLDMNTHFNTGFASLPVHVSYADLHLAQLQLRLDDSTGQALSSAQLPGSLSLDSFDYSALDLTLVGRVTTEVRRDDFATAADFTAAQAWVDANVRFTYVQVAFTGLPFATLSALAVSSVPEPATWALGAFGLLGVAGAAHRRRA